MWLVMARSVSWTNRLSGEGLFSAPFRSVNRRWIGTPDRHPKGTPLSGGFGR